MPILAFLAGLATKAVAFLSTTVLPMIGGALLTKIPKWIASVTDIADAPAYNEATAMLDDTLKMHELLEKKRSGFLGIGSEIERNFIKNGNSIAETLIGLTTAAKNEADIKFDVDSIRDMLDRETASFNGGLSDLVTRRIAIGDSECANILKNESGTERGDALESYMKKILEQGVARYYAEFSKTINNHSAHVADLINVRIDEKQRELQGFIKEIDDLGAEFTASQIEEKQAQYRSQLALIEDSIALVSGL
jgi:hypothetical protein